MEHLNSLHLLAGDRVPFLENIETGREASHKETTKPLGVLQLVFKSWTRKALSPSFSVLLDNHPEFRVHVGIQTWLSPAPSILIRWKGQITPSSHHCSQWASRLRKLVHKVCRWLVEPRKLQGGNLLHPGEVSSPFQVPPWPRLEWILYLWIKTLFYH